MRRTISVEAYDLTKDEIQEAIEWYWRRKIGLIREYSKKIGGKK